MLTVSSVVYGLNFLFLVGWGALLFEVVRARRATANAPRKDPFDPFLVENADPRRKHTRAHTNGRQRTKNNDNKQNKKQNTGPQPGRPSQQGGGAAPSRRRARVRVAGAAVDRARRQHRRRLLPAAPGSVRGAFVGREGEVGGKGAEEPKDIDGRERDPARPPQPLLLPPRGPLPRPALNERNRRPPGAKKTQTNPVLSFRRPPAPATSTKRETTPLATTRRSHISKVQRQKQTDTLRAPPRPAPLTRACPRRRPPASCWTPAPSRGC